MSYCRTGDDSDVYVVYNAHGYNCLGCSLTPDYQWPDACFETPDEMLSHLSSHKKAGEKVPKRCIERINHDKEFGQQAWFKSKGGTA